MSNTITIELCAEDRKRIDELIAFAGLIAAGMNSHNTADVPVFKHEPAEEHPVDAVSPHGLPEPAAEPAVEPEQPKYTKADILAKVQQLAHPGNPKRGQAKTIVQSYAGKVSDIPEDKYDEVMEKLIALEVEA